MDASYAHRSRYDGGVDSDRHPPERASEIQNGWVFEGRPPAKTATALAMNHPMHVRQEIVSPAMIPPGFPVHTVTPKYIRGEGIPVTGDTHAGHYATSMHVKRMMREHRERQAELDAEMYGAGDDDDGGGVIDEFETDENGQVVRRHRLLEHHDMNNGFHGVHTGMLFGQGAPRKVPLGAISKAQKLQKPYHRPAQALDESVHHKSSGTRGATVGPVFSAFHDANADGGDDTISKGIKHVYWLASDATVKAINISSFLILVYAWWDVAAAFLIQLTGVIFSADSGLVAVLPDTLRATLIYGQEGVVKRKPNIGYLILATLIVPLVMYMLQHLVDHDFEMMTYGSSTVDSVRFRASEQAFATRRLGVPTMPSAASRMPMPPPPPPPPSTTPQPLSLTNNVAGGGSLGPKSSGLFAPMPDAQRQAIANLAASRM